MRVALLLAVILALGLLGPTNAQCILKNVETAICERLNDVESIDSEKLTSLSTSVLEKTLRSTSLKRLSPSLKSLDLSDGEIEIVEPGTFLNMTGLVDLRMSDNSIAQFKESAFDGLGKLKNFDLRRNNIRQLPPALTKLKALKNLEVSGNPLICNCDTLRVRDDLLTNAVKISKKVFCMSPPNLKGVSLLEPDTEVICMFEEQDAEMQADEAAGSGDAEDDLPEYIVTELPHIPPVPSEDETSDIPVIVTDDLIIPVLGRSGLDSAPVNSTDVKSDLDSSNSSAPVTGDDSLINTDDFVFASPDAIDDSLITVEGSGATEPEEEGSGEEGSGLWVPINPRDFLKEDNITEVTTTEEPTTASPSWYDVWWSAAFGGDSSATTPSSKGDPDDNMREDEFFTTITAKTVEQSSTKGLPENIDNTEEAVVSEKVDILESTNAPNLGKKLDKIAEEFDNVTGEDNTSIDDVGEASTHQSKKSMGSYVVLAALLGVLGALVGFAAYKSSICKKKSNEDPERGSELKDIRKSLLDTNNTNQPKIALNGNTENAPLVEPNQDPWSGPQEIRQWTDQHTPKADNGTKYTPSAAESDPVKPPRKSLPPQDEPNGLQEVKTHSPMSTFAPRTHEGQPNSFTPPNSPSSGTEYVSHSPPLSPNTQRVKITLQENPDSVPKTPILITRTKPGVNLVKTP